MTRSQDKHSGSFENWAAVLARGLNVEAYVRPRRVGYDVIVELRDEGSAIIAAGIQLRRLPERTFQG